MPSASNKLEKQASLEVSETVKMALSVIEKKVRNLEKRKSKLDAYKSQSEELQEQQKEALTKYEEVVSTLEFSRELAKQITQISVDAAKGQKKLAKREQMEHQAKEIQRLKEVLMINNVLSAMGDDKSREDFLAGKNGALLLTEEDLQRLDNLFKLVTPTRNTSDEENSPPYEQQLTSASEHLVAILDGKKKEILGTTYTNLKELIFGVHDCGYFKPEAQKEEPVANGESPEFESEVEPVVSEEKIEETVPVVESDDNLENAVAESESSVPKVTLAATEGTFQPEDNSVFSTFTHTKPYTEVFTSSQGSFNFLQESQIDPDSPHMDPAVVAVNQMVPNSNRPTYPNQPTTDLLPSQYPNQLVNDGQHVINSNSPANMTATHYIQPVQAITASHLQDFSQIPTQTYTNQHYVAVPSFATPIYGQVPTQPVTQSEDPNWISENKKQHYMNVNATAFESMTYKGEEPEANSENVNSNAEQNDAQKFASNNDNQGYQNQGNYQQRSGYNNYRGNSGRGASGSSSGRGSRGNNYSRGGDNNNRGNRQGSNGNGGNNMRNNQGSGNYQGYREGGFNNYQRDNFNGSGSYNNGGSRRGTAGSNAPTGRDRGGSRGTGMNSRGTSGPRGGAAATSGNYAKTSA